MRKIGLAACIFALICDINAESAKQIFTVRDAIEATRVLNPDHGDPVLVSPNGKKYLVVLQRGDIRRNGSWIDLLCGNTSPLAKASRPNLVARLFSRSTADVNNLIKNIRWLADSTHVVFLWDDGLRPAHITSVDVRTGRLRTLIQHPAPIVKYDIDHNGRATVFIAHSPHDLSALAKLRRNGFAVTGQSIWSLVRGDADGWDPRQHYDVFASSSPGLPARKVQIPQRLWATPPELLNISPDGHYALVVLPVGDPPPEWDRYTEHILKSIYLRQARQHPDRPNWVRQYFLIDIRSATARPLWNAPESPFGEVVWAPDSRHLVVGPTFLPVENADAGGLAGRAVVEVDVPSGQFTSLPTPANPAEFGYAPTSWSKDDVIELAEADKDSGTKLRLRKVQGAWRSIPGDSHIANAVSPVRVEIRQGPNTPPALYRVETPTGRAQLLEDFNPQFRHFRLGRTELVHWTATDGKLWTGMLYYPADYTPGRQFPLVIQTHGYSTTDFSLDGSFTTVFAAQPLASRGIAVLQAGGPDSETEDELGTSREVRTYVAGFEGAIQHFVESGMADPERVGIIGFSRSGWIVLYMLTHSQLPLAAAEVADNIDGSYFQYVLADSDMRTFDDVEKGSAPFGKDLEVWMREAPGFNADKVCTPLRMELDSAPISQILAEWEVFSNIQYLGKPVELFVIPDIEHGVHVLQNPAQRIASQGGTVDWFTFWLKGEEDPDPTKIDQYIRWRKLRWSHQAVGRK